jgi:hypothetical protein
LVKITRNSLKSLILCAAFVTLTGWAVQAEELYAPDYLWQRHIADKTDPVEIADTYLRIPYRDDGVLDSRGNFTTFAHPEKLFDTPGLNCSGLVVSVCRFLFNKNWDLESVTRDRRGNGGTGSPLGKDWDFGWNLILNLTDATKRRLLMPDGHDYPLDSVDGLTMRGFNLHDGRAWSAVLSQMRPGRVYLGSLSKPSHRPGYKVLHYHVVLILPDSHGGVWLYHATRRSNVHKMNINTQAGLHHFMSQFRNDRGGAKDVLIVEAVLPDLRALTASAPEGQSGPSTQEASPAGHETSGTASPPTKETSESRAAAPAVEPTSQEQANASASSAPPQVQQPLEPELVIEHRSGRVFRSLPDLITHIPKFGDKQSNSVAFWFRNYATSSRDLEILVKGPSGHTRFQGRIPENGKDLTVVFPRDFENGASMSLAQGQYVDEVLVDGVRWLTDVFAVTQLKEAEPKILEVRAPKTVKQGQTFTVKVVARNAGAESDYGGITVSSPVPSGLRIVSANPGKVFSPGSTVLSVTSDKIRTKVPMAERWINLWGEDQPYDMQVRVKAGRPGTYPLYVRCALRGVNVKSSVVLMDPAKSSTADQQGFPVYAHTITVE